jgi:hypothetical protein
MAVLVAAVVLMSTGSASATTVRDCRTTSATLSFSNGFTTALTSGTATWSYTVSCLVVDTNGAAGFQNYSSSLTYSYSGSCVLATMSRPGETARIAAGAGVWSWSAAGQTGTGAFVLDPTRVCFAAPNEKIPVVVNNGVGVS